MISERGGRCGSDGATTAGGTTLGALGATRRGLSRHGVVSGAGARGVWRSDWRGCPGKCATLVAPQGGAWVISDVFPRQTAATAWRQVICSGKGRDSDREHSGSGREHSSSGSGSGSGSGSVCARALSPPALCAPLPSPARAPWPHTSPRPAVGVFQIQNVALYRRTQNQVRREGASNETSRPALQNRF